MENVAFEICALGVLEQMNLLNGEMTIAYFADDGEFVKCLYAEFGF